MKSKSKHGGKREGAGRPPRPNAKAKSVWCGQITDEEREFIIKNLTPEERLEALLKAARKKPNDR